MIIRPPDHLELEPGEPVQRGCWQCCPTNGSYGEGHLHYCRWCGRTYIDGRYLCEVSSVAQLATEVAT